jgi:hypothetical protein
VADAALLDGLQAELLRPETLDYISTSLTEALNGLVEARPRQREEFVAARAVIEQKLKNLIAAVENGAGSPNIFQAIQERETELRVLDGQLAALNQPMDRRLAVIPSWVRRQLSDVANLLREGPERAKAEFQRLKIRFTITPVYEEGRRVFLRAEGSGDFEHIAFSSRYADLSTVDAFHQ